VKRASEAARAVTAGAGLGVVVLSVVLVGGLGSSPSYDTTYGDRSASFALLEVVVGAGLLVAGLMLLSARPTAMLGTVAVAASAAWFAPVWVGWEGGPPLLRDTGLVVAPLLPAVVLVAAAAVPPPPTGIGRLALHALAVIGTTTTAAASILLALVRDPIRDRYCWSDCSVSAFLVHDDPALARRVTWFVLGLGAAIGVLVALAAAVRLAGAAAVTRRVSGPALAAAGLSGLALAANAFSLVLEPREAPSRPLYELLFIVRAFALLALAGGLAWIALRPRLVRSLVTRLAVDLDRSAAGGGLGRLLSRALGDPGLRLGYPIVTGERIVDADGRPFTLDATRRVTPVLGAGGVVAVVESDVTSVGALESELGPAAQLALGNERLRAEALARLAEVTGSRARIVETADAARRRIERDLHDGAQQRMLALTYDLRVALTIAESSGDERASAPLRDALERAVSASQELRDVAHGIFPAELTASGLEAALESLADLRPLRLVVELSSGRRYGADVETAAYAVVAEAVEDGGELRVTLAERDGGLHVTVEGEVDWEKRLVRLEDRVGAAGGSVRASGRRLEAMVPAPTPSGVSLSA
jgi:signal transduction histidine kinase